MTIHIVMGPPASGKSTFAWSQRAEDEPIVDFDALAAALGSKQPHASPEPIGQVGFAARAGAIARIFDGLNADAWVIATNASAEKIAAWAEQDVKFYLVDPGIDECLARAAADSRPEGTEDLIRAWYDSPPELPEDAVIVTDPPTEKGKTMAELRTKAFTVKAANDEDAQAGVFTGYASVFNNIDSYYDMVVPGAFEETLRKWGPDGAGIPCYWSHQMNDPLMNLGATLSAVEDSHGLLVKVQLDLDNPNAAYVRKLLVEGRVRQMSFAYHVREAAWVERAREEGDSYYELRKLDIHEVSVVQIGANQETEILDAKAAAERAAKKELPAPTRVDGTAAASGEDLEPANDEEPTWAKSEEPASGKRVSASSVQVKLRALALGLYDKPMEGNQDG